MVRLLQAWLWLREKGQGLVEYALILVLIAVVVIVVLSLLGTQVSAVFSQIASALSGS
jgi:pilus assembly protein Flp/PilA